MNRRSRIASSVAVLAAVGAALLLAACGNADSLGPDDETAVTVGAAKVTNGQVERRAKFLATAPNEQGEAEAPAADSDAYWDLRRTAAAQLRDEVVFRILASRCGKPCAVPDREIEEQVTAIQTEQFNGSKAEFDKVLAERGITRDDLEASLRANLQEQRLTAREQATATFGEAQARAYYAKNIAQYRVPAEKRLSHVLVGSRAAALDLRAQISPDTFADTAKTRSLDPAAKSTGGDLGTTTSPGLIPEIQAAASKLAPGVISQPVESQFGWHLLLVTAVPARTKPFEEVRSTILTEQLQLAQVTAVQTWRDTVVKKLQDSAKFTNSRIAPEPPATTSSAAATTTGTTTAARTTTGATTTAATTSTAGTSSGTTTAAP